MTKLRRKTRIRGFPMGPLECRVICEICDRLRNKGNHHKCSAERQRRAQEKKS